MPSNEQRSHAGPVALDWNTDALPALAGASRWALKSSFLHIYLPVAQDPGREQLGGAARDLDLNSLASDWECKLGFVSAQLWSLLLERLLSFGPQYLLPVDVDQLLD